MGNFVLRTPDVYDSRPILANRVWQLMSTISCEKDLFVLEIEQLLHFLLSKLALQKLSASND